MEFTDYQIRSLKRKNRSHVIVNRMSGDILTTLVSILCADDEEVTIFDGRGLTDKQLLREQLSEVQDGYIVFTHLSEIPDGQDAEIIRSLIYLCIKGDWRNAREPFFAEIWMNPLSLKSIGVIAISEGDEYKNSLDFKKMVGKGVCTYCAINDNGYEMIE